MRPASTLLWLVLFGSVASAYACGSDDKPAGPGGDDGGSPAAGEGNQAGTKPGTSGDAGTNGQSGGSTGEGGSTSSEGGSAVAEGGAAGGAPPSEGGSTSEGGAQGEAGAGGEVIVGPPDLITSTGGPWPDSASALCQTATKLSECPQLDDPFFGQDGTYRINVPTYGTTPNVVTDKVTGLVWQRETDDVSRTQAQAADYCDTLDLGGQQDWRLPTRLELVTILDLGLPNGYAMPPPFSVSSAGSKWTASVAATTESGYFAVNETYGMWTVAIDSTTASTRCVRGAPLSGTLTVGSDSTSDSMTELEWQTTNLDDTLVDWQAALGYCETLEHAGKTDWRLPNMKELATLVDETALVAPTVDSASFGSSSAENYWSSTPALSFGNERFALCLTTSIGYSSSLKASEAVAAARCVRTADQ